MQQLIFKVLAVILLVTYLAGCAGAPTSRDEQFLGQKVTFKDATDGSGAQVYRAPGLTVEKLAGYNRFIVDPVMLWYSDTSAYTGIFPDELKAIADYTRSAIVNSLAPGYDIVEEPGPDVLRIRVAITNMERSKPLKAVNFIPVGAVVFGVEEVTGLNDPTRKKIAKGYSYIIKANIEGAVYDSQSGQLLAAYKDSARTRHADAEKGDYIHPEKGATWGQVKGALDHWAAMLKQRIDWVHEKN